jgi:hypothetical protein
LLVVDAKHGAVDRNRQGALLGRLHQREDSVDRRRIGPQTALQARRQPDRGSPHLPRRHGRRSRRGIGSLGGLIFALIRMGSSARSEAFGSVPRGRLWTGRARRTRIPSTESGKVRGSTEPRRHVDQRNRRRAFSHSMVCRPWHDARPATVIQCCEGALGPVTDATAWRVRRSPPRRSLPAGPDLRLTDPQILDRKQQAPPRVVTKPARPRVTSRGNVIPERDWTCQARANPDC